MDRSLISRAQQQLFRFTGSITDASPADAAFTLDFEIGRYRENELVGLIRDIVPYFALTEREIAALDRSEWYRTAFTRVSEAKRESKGDYGEVLLYLLLTVFNEAPKFVTKARLRTSTKEQIKGFDCAHFSINNEGQPQLWLGEAKFHKDISGAIRSAARSVNNFLGSDINKTKAELRLLGGSMEINRASDGVYDQIKSYLDGTVTLDKVPINVPVLLTYDSECVDKFCGDSRADIESPSFRTKFEEEASQHFSAIRKNEWPSKKTVNVLFILVPFSCVANVKKNLESVEEAMRF